MFCIAAFIVLVIISIFSARYRRMAKKAWQCVGRRVTFRPCDTNFKEELKSKLLAKVALRAPKWLKAADIALEVAAFIIVALTIWSLLVVVKSGLNLYVYGTCNPSNAGSCSLGAEACSIETATPSFVTSVKTFKVHEWVWNEVENFGETIAAIPTRMQNWKAEEYLPQNVSYEKPFNQNKPTALEIIDPGCQFCKQLYSNQKEANFSARYNLAYIAYPIKNPATTSGYKFKHSYFITSYLEAIKLHPLKDAPKPADWFILDKIFTGTTTGTGNQLRINVLLDRKEVRTQLNDWLKEAGYDEEQIKQIEKTAESNKVKQTIEANRAIVEDKVKTVKIPTIIYDGRRHGGVVSIEDLQN